jgi:hypothetical protein
LKQTLVKSCRSYRDERAWGVGGTYSVVKCGSTIGAGAKCRQVKLQQQCAEVIKNASPVSANDMRKATDETFPALSDLLVTTQNMASPPDPAQAIAGVIGALSETFEVSTSLTINDLDRLHEKNQSLAKHYSAMAKAAGNLDQNAAELKAKCTNKYSEV